MTLKQLRGWLEDIKVIVTIVLSLGALLGWTYNGKVEAETETVHTRAQVTAVANAYTLEACQQEPPLESKSCVQMVRELRGIVEGWHN